MSTFKGERGGSLTTPGHKGLGDRLAAALGVVGITEARWLWVKSWFVNEPKCGCKKRKEALNKFGRDFWWSKSAK